MRFASRRKFFANALAPALLGAMRPHTAAAQARGTSARLRVQWTNGGHTLPLKYYTMMDDDMFHDLDSTLLSFPNPFRTLTGAGDQPVPDVLVLCDYAAPWTEQDKENARKFVEAGKGVVILHHAVGDGAGDWDWWVNEVSGVVLFKPGMEGAKTQQRLKAFPRQTLTPVGDHPIVRGMHPFQMPYDEVFPNMSLSPGITPLINSDDPDMIKPTIAWIGPNPQHRAVCFECGHTQWVCADPRYRRIVHTMILWAGRRLTS